MAKLTRERLWLLKRFPEYGWGMGPMSLIGIKKWDIHKEALVNSGHLEKDEDGLFRVTDAGRSAPNEEAGK